MTYYSPRKISIRLLLNNFWVQSASFQPTGPSSRAPHLSPSGWESSGAQLGQYSVPGRWHLPLIAVRQHRALPTAGHKPALYRPNSYKATTNSIIVDVSIWFIADLELMFQYGLWYAYDVSIWTMMDSEHTNWIAARMMAHQHTRWFKRSVEFHSGKQQRW